MGYTHVSKGESDMSITLLSKLTLSSYIEIIVWDATGTDLDIWTSFDAHLT